MIMERDGVIKFLNDQRAELEGLTECKVDPERVAAFNAYCGRRSSREEIAAYFILGGMLVVLGGATMTGIYVWATMLISGLTTILG